MKGYRAFHQYALEIKQFKLTNNFKYFSSIRHKLLIESQYIIRFYWLKYKRSKNKSRSKRPVKNPPVQPKVENTNVKHKRQRKRSKTHIITKISKREFNLRKIQQSTKNTNSFKMEARDSNLSNLNEDISAVTVVKKKRKK